MTLTMEPKDWINTGLEDDAGGVVDAGSGLERRGDERTRPLRGFDVELRRKPGEGFGFVIASQDVENGKGENNIADARGCESVLTCLSVDSSSGCHNWTCITQH